ncbi:MAG: STAS domain-containing protein [Terriglobales bacterium]
MLTVTIKHLGDVVTLRCVGKIVHGEETAILCAAVEQHGQSLVLDLVGVDAIDAAGIGLLVSLQAAGIYLKLLNPTKQVREVLRVTQLESVFEICESPSTKQGDVTREQAEPVGRVLTQS